MARLEDAHLSNVRRFAPGHVKKFFLTFFLKKNVIFNSKFFYLENSYFINYFCSVTELPWHLGAAVHHVQ